MNAVIRFILGLTTLSAILTYAWWTRFRVWKLRQDLFAIRDDLWDAMRCRGELDNTHHRETRRVINALVRIAPLLSIFTLLRFKLQDHSPTPPLPQDCPTAVVEARNLFMDRVSRYLFRETLSGFGVKLAVLAINCGMVPMRVISAKLAGMMRPIVESEDFVHFSEVAPQERTHSMSGAR